MVMCWIMGVLGALARGSEARYLSGRGVAGLSRVLAAFVDILDVADQRVRSESPFSAGAVGPGHGVSHPQQWLLAP